VRGRIYTLPFKSFCVTAMCDFSAAKLQAWTSDSY
jgi:hypothetical protein